MANDEQIRFDKAFAQRTKALRMAHDGWTQQQMADALNIPLERYKKYENRSPMRHDLIPRFCLIVGVTIDQLYDVRRPLYQARRGGIMQRVSS